VAYIPGKNLGLSFWRKTVVAKIPPMPPKDMTRAVVTARLECEMMLFEDYREIRVGLDLLMAGPT
jgi:hypothetical protein